MITDANASASHQRARLQAAVQKLAFDLDAGTVERTLDDLLRLADECDRHHLHPEAARVRSWVGRPPFARGSS